MLSYEEFLTKVENLNPGFRLHGRTDQLEDDSAQSPVMSVKSMWLGEFLGFDCLML